MRALTLTIVAAFTLVGSGLAQERPGGQRPQEPTRQAQEGARVAGMAQTQQQRQLQHMAQHTEQLAVQIRETNQWMARTRRARNTARWDSSSPPPATSFATWSARLSSFATATRI